MIITNHLSAERSVLSTLMSYEDQYDVISSLITVSDFESAAHQRIYEAIVSLAEKNQPFDLVMVDDFISNSASKHDKDYVSRQLAEVAAVPEAMPKSLLSHAELIRASSLRRKSLQILKQGIEQLDNLDDVQEVQNSIMSGLLSVNNSDDDEQQIFGFDDMAKQMIEHIELTKSGIKPYLDTGFPELDALMQVKNGDLVIVAARPSMGKSLIAVNMQSHLAKFKEGASVFFSVEMNELSVMQRIAASECSIPLQHIKNDQMTTDEWARMQRFLTDMPTERLKVVRDTNLSVSAIRKNLVRIKRDYGKISSIGIDYLQLMDGLSGDDSVKRIGDVTRSLKIIADEFDCPVFLLSQLNRAVEKRPNKRPTMSDLRDSGSIEQDADVIMFLYREDYYKKMAGETDFDGMADIIIAKNRDGETGTKRLAFEGHLGRFSNSMPFDSSFNDIPSYGEQQ